MLPRTVVVGRRLADRESRGGLLICQLGLFLIRGLFCLQTSGINVVVGSLQVPDTTVLVEMYCYDTAGSSLTFLAGGDPTKVRQSSSIDHVKSSAKAI
jgi:hypothetical protein